MKIVNNIVAALMEESNKFENNQKEELLGILNKIDLSVLPTDYELQRDPRKIKKFMAVKDEMQKHLSEFGKKYQEFGGKEETTDRIIEENNKL